MRLVSIRLRNYRVHRDREITFDPARNLIGWPNESGKSTLAEAIHRVLFLRTKTGGALRNAMLSTHAGDPEVTLCFEAAGALWTLEKRFAGAARGSTRLTRSGAATLKDDEADVKLSELLGTETGGRVNEDKLNATWSHLWVWQGDSGEDPALHATSHKDNLVRRLQQDGIGAIMQSATDQAVRAKIAASHDSLFTTTGKPKAGSPAETARARLADAEEALQRAAGLAGKLDQAADAQDRAHAEISAAEALLPDLRTTRITLEEKLVEVADLRSKEQTQRQSLESKTNARLQLAKDDQAIVTLILQAAEAATSLLPAEEKQTALAAAESVARLTDQALTKTLQTAAADVRQARLLHDLALAALGVFEKSAAHTQLATRAAEAEQVRAEGSSIRSSLSQLPLLTADDLATLHKLDRDAGHAATALAAMATGLELITSDQPVTLDGNPLHPGQHPILTDDGELVIGTATRLRIRPGGGSSLAAARATLTTSQSTLADALARLGLRDLDHATTTLEQRRSLDQQLARQQERWKTLGGEALTTSLSAAANALESARAEHVRRQALAGDAPAPSDLAAATAHLAACQENLTRAESAESNARHQAAAAASALRTASETLQHHAAEITASRQTLRDLQTRLSVLEETHGDSPVRQAKLAQATESELDAQRHLTHTREALARLEPDSLTADLERYHRSIAQQEARLQDAKTQLAVTQSQLTLDGSSDPRADLRHAIARRDAALADFASEQRHAAAIATLHQLFATTGEAMARSLVQPLAERITGYLECLFGSGAGISLDLSDHAITGFELTRPGGSSFAFSTLSGGTREQVAAATRLAMAEILANDHDGCLPILFDDAFAYTDPDRIRRLQRMLDLAASRGLQVIILTCTPDQYSALGAHRIVMAG